MEWNKELRNKIMQICWLCKLTDFDKYAKVIQGVKVILSKNSSRSVGYLYL